MSLRSLFICLIASVVGSLAGMAYALPGGHLLPRQPRHLFQQTGSRTRIELHGSLLSVRLRDAPWDQVVKELEQQTGISLRAATPLQGTLTEEFEALPLERALRRLFRDANLVLLYEKGAQDQGSPDTLRQVWLFPRGAVPGENSQPQHLNAGATAMQSTNAPILFMQMAAQIAGERISTPEKNRPAVKADGEEPRTDLYTPGWESNETALQTAIFDSNPALQERAFEVLAERDPEEGVALLLGAAKSEQAETRLHALRLLHQTVQPQDEVVLSAFRDAISDEDMAVKSYAIQALAEQGGPNTMDLLRRAYGDRDPSVRLVVVENMVKTEGALPLLQEAASDEDDAVRSFAVSWLERTTSVER